MISRATTTFTSTRNACKLCTPLGACLAFSGIEGALPFLHGSQGCATYIRRYMISHFREPLDVASSNFSEQSAVFGGEKNLTVGLANVIASYRPTMVGVATTCLSETIGDDVNLFLHEFRKERGDIPTPPIVHVSTPSYAGTHAEGYTASIRAICEQLAEDGPRVDDAVTILPAMVSPADIRHLKDIVAAFGFRPIILPDYSDRLDGPTWNAYHRIPDGGTTLADAAAAGRTAGIIEMTSTAKPKNTGGHYLAERFGTALHQIHMPTGVTGSDALFKALESITGKQTPARYAAARGRLIDSYVDAHKQVYGKRCLIYGEEDLAVGLTSLLCEVGLTPVLVASGGESGRFDQVLRESVPDLPAECHIASGVDFEEITDLAEELEPEIVVGHSKGFKLARKLEIPLVRVGFPIHDRIGGARVLHVGYEGTQQLFDTIANSLLEARQHASEVDFTYL